MLLIKICRMFIVHLRYCFRCHFWYSGSCIETLPVFDWTVRSLSCSFQLAGTYNLSHFSTFARSSGERQMSALSLKKSQKPSSENRSLTGPNESFGIIPPIIFGKKRNLYHFSSYNLKYEEKTKSFRLSDVITEC